MYFKVVKLKKFKVSGLSTELSRSMSQNLLISKNTWNNFNKILKSNRLNRNKFWTGYGFTYNKDNQYRYFVGVPFIEPAPLDFESKVVPESYCLVFEHIGKFKNLNNTINQIYREFIPNNHFKPKIENYFHFEKYDYRFDPNSDKSIIEIFVPIDILKRVVYKEDD